MLQSTRTIRAWLWRWMATLAFFALLLVLAPRAVAQGDPAQGPGGPILVVTSGPPTFGKYYAEILRTEGLNAFTVADISTVTAGSLAEYDVVVLAKMSLTPTQVTTLSNWVNGGGNLIAMAPDAQLAGLLGITPSGGSLLDGYLLVNTSAPPGNGIVSQTIQFHGVADRYNLNGATQLAGLYSSATTLTGNPAVTLRDAGAGKAAAFAYDLAASIVYTRQGNPAWAAQERDGFPPIRSDDKFYGAKAGDVQADWIDLSKVAIPQADEQQRLLANLILHMNTGKKPLPRFWYFPHGKKAVVLMSGDDHGNGGTAARFDQFKAASPPGCSLADWECVRGTSYIFTSTPLSNAAAAQYEAEGFEVGLHINTSCADYTLSSLDAFYAQQVPAWRAKYSSVSAPSTQRHHCIAWSDWSSGAEVQFNYGMRLDTSYYFWPPSWVNNVPGMFTGSAMPMRFAKADGSFVDVYMSATQLTDESGQAYPYTIDTLLDRALGAEGYYGVYTVNAHTDLGQIPESDAVVTSALARGVPIVSARQMLTWLDARNGSSFGSISRSGNTLSFSVTRNPSAIGLQGMLPMRWGSTVLGSLTRGGGAVSFTASTIKGVEYAFFAADGGSYVATYASDTLAPQVANTTPAAGATGVSVTARPTATFNEAMDPATVNAATFVLRDAANAVVNASVAYEAATRTATLLPSASLAALTTYTATLRGGSTDPRVKDLAGNALSADVSWSFTTATGPSCPCSGWGGSTTPSNPSVNDPNAVELGVKFRSDVNGFVTGVRFYKGAGNTGTHIGNLWSASGALLAQATFTSETATGWQQVNFATPVAITANTVYVVSYFAPNGNYAADTLFFANGGIDNPPIHLLSNAAAGGNGVYAYSASSTFPASTYQAANYWVDVVFTTSGPADTTPPTVTATTPTNGATGVALASSVTALFSEPIDPATVNTGTFELRTPSNALVAGTMSYDAATRGAAFTPSAPLSATTTYTAVLRGGATDPRIKDVAGNPLSTTVTWSFTTGVFGGACASPANAIVAENCLTGSPASEWDVSGAGDPSIQGFATDISVNRGTTVSFKVKTTATAYRLDIYRMGYYGGLGARKVATVSPSTTLPQSQPDCLPDAASGLIDCGNWAVSGSWAVPANVASGIYFAKVIRSDTGGASHIVFIVRNDAGTSDLLFQTADTTWQAYNDYGGNSLYTGAPAGRAYKVSYNRPFNTRAVDGGQDWLFNAEYPMVRWLEANGYDVSYFSGVDTDRYGSLLLNHKIFLSVGHDEYWSGAQRANVEAARNAGKNLAFFSGNEIFWKTRWENSIDGSASPYRTLVSYKETRANAKIDPSAAWTGTWRDPRFSPPSDGGKPENALTGTIFMANDTGQDYSIVIPEADGKMRFWRNTSVATLGAGQSATLPVGTLGYEWDADLDNGFRPAGLFRLSTTTLSISSVLQDYGSTYAPGTLTHALTLYKHNSGGLVFGAGTIQWSWGLDASHDGPSMVTDARIQQATVNLFADMGVQPATLQGGLVPASASTDTVAPTSIITSPAAGTTVSLGTVTITGTASDAGGAVGSVEVSVDGGITWRRANGRANWTYSWSPSAAGSVVIKARAVDDSGNLETPGAGVSMTVGAQTCPCSIWPPSAVPTVVSDGDTGSVNLGVKFRSDVDGFITGIRFYKGTANTGTHIGTLWTGAGAQLATATFTNETASGWQQVTFSTPVAITANTVYVASYLAPNGRYAGDNGYFGTSGVDNPPLHALQNGVSGGNGVYAYAATTTFPTSTYESSNYWVDVVFTTGVVADTTPPTVSANTPASGAAGVANNSAVTATFSEAMSAGTITNSTFVLRNGTTAVTATVSYNAATFVATLTPSASLAGATTYTATVLGGGAGVKDSAGNALAVDRTWSFTTAAVDSTPPTVTLTSPLSGATGVSGTSNVTASFSEAMNATTIGSTTFELRDPANNLVAAAVSYNATSRVATLNPTPTLNPATVYTATIRGGTTEPRVKDAAGNVLVSSATWSFTVAPDTIPPTVSSTSPVNLATGVSPIANVTATFSEAMNATTIGSTTFELRDPSNNVVPAVVSYNATTRVATLNPTPNLVGGSTYSAIVRGGAAGVKDAAGNAMAVDRVWTFTIETTPPTVTSTTPASGATGVSRTANITAVFSEAMASTTVNTGTVELHGPGSVLVSSVVTLSTNGRTVTLNPAPTLAALSTYTVTIRGGTADPRVKDVAGNPLGSTRSWSFTTGP
jgi:Domain of unknown function (DUF4082)/Bacterial Ig-like domain